MFERNYVQAKPPRGAPLPVRVSRRSQLITALRQRVRPIVIEDQELACPFARLLRARELQVWAPGEVVADTMSYAPSAVCQRSQRKFTTCGRIIKSCTT
jgi:hypothetical protein